MSDFTADTEKVSQLLLELAYRIGADGVTCWLAKPGELVAVVNPLEPAIVGMSQTLERGIISQVFVTGQAILEADVTSHQSHDRSVDEAMATRIRSLMAAPWGTDHLEGVVSAVQHVGSEKCFTLESLHTLSETARRLTSLMSADA